jgi:hypothetical protein
MVASGAYSYERSKADREEKVTKEEPVEAERKKITESKGSYQRKSDPGQERESRRDEDCTMREGKRLTSFQTFFYSISILSCLSLSIFLECGGEPYRAKNEAYRAFSFGALNSLARLQRMQANLDFPTPRRVNFTRGKTT